ncbi:hypothetical protein CDO51_12230 [Natranaerobius trueperi]|uniref:Uncharacterized protein n=1 Tax=Natranaerobius trueperi TaxID=759412 RepID=A0A226BXD7_9FIRM|nr:hypothetical protein CDO51_12230 [Natranaerobius trueperi]
MKFSKGLWKVMNNYLRIAFKQNQTLTNYSLGSERVFFNEIYPSLIENCKTNKIPDSNEIEEFAN